MDRRPGNGQKHVSRLPRRPHAHARPMHSPSSSTTNVSAPALSADGKPDDPESAWRQSLIVLAVYAAGIATWLLWGQSHYARLVGRFMDWIN